MEQTRASDEGTRTGGPDAEPSALDQPEVDQPGLRELRETVANHITRRLPGRAMLRQDAIAGLNGAISNVPDGMANGILVGVNPLYGLYANMMGPLVGGALSSTQLMVITTTAAGSLTAGHAISALPPGARDNALFVMVILIGATQLLLGALRLGRFTRFVSYSVTTGLLAGISVLLILGQLPTVTGYAARGGNKVLQAIDLLSHPGEVDLWSMAMAGLTLALALLLPRTPLGNLGRLVAIVVPSLLVAGLHLGSVRVVQDVGEIPSGFPLPDLPSFLVALNVLTGALSVAVVILVQGTGVSQSVPNPDQSRISVSRDFIAQGAANVASGLFRGLPVGGSLSATALNVMTDARTRWAAIFAGLWMAVIVVGFPGQVSHIAMPALGALLILAGVRSLKPRELRSIWNTGWPSRLASATTFLCTLLLPIQAAVGIGVVLAALLYMNESSVDISVVELVERPDGRIEERTPTGRLPARSVTVLDVYGHLFYAGARTLEEMLPTPRGAAHPVVVLRLRGRATLGATLIDVLYRYARELQKAGGRLYLAGVSKAAHRQVAHSGKFHLTGPVRVYEATPIIGQATREARADAETWLVGLDTDAALGDSP